MSTRKGVPLPYGSLEGRTMLGPNLCECCDAPGIGEDRICQVFPRLSLIRRLGKRRYPHRNTSPGFRSRRSCTLRTRRPAASGTGFAVSISQVRLRMFRHIALRFFAPIRCQSSARPFHSHFLSIYLARPSAFCLFVGALALDSPGDPGRAYERTR